MNKKLKLILFSLVFLISIVTIIFRNIYLFKSQKNIQTNLNKTVYDNKNNTIKLPNKLDKNSQNENELNYGNNDGKTISKTEGLMIIEQARQMIRSAEWDKAYSIVKEAVNKYNLNTEEGKIIQKLYYDISLVLNLKDADYSMYKNIILGMKDPETILCAVLQLPEELRRDLIINEDSLSPIVDPPIIVNSVSEEKGEMFEYASYIENMDKMYKIDFIAENIPLEAYIIQFKDGNMKIYMIKAKEGTVHYFKTIKFWKDLDEGKIN